MGNAKDGLCSNCIYYTISWALLGLQLNFFRLMVDPYRLISLLCKPLVMPYYHYQQKGLFIKIQEDAVCVVKSILLHCKSSELTQASLLTESVLTAFSASGLV